MPVGLEADDVLASAARFAAEAGARTVIMTSDRDAFSLIDDNTRVLRIINGGVEASPTLTPERLQLMLGITPAQYRDYAAMRGDASDNLPGVNGSARRRRRSCSPRWGARRPRSTTSPPMVVGCWPRWVPGQLVDSLIPMPAWPGSSTVAVMAMHDDVALDLDLAGGRGCLPLKRRCDASGLCSAPAGLDHRRRTARARRDEIAAPPVSPASAPDHVAQPRTWSRSIARLPSCRRK